MKPFSTPVLSKRTYRELKLLKHIQHENVSHHPWLIWSHPQICLFLDYQSQWRVYLTAGRSVRDASCHSHLIFPFLTIFLTDRYFVTELLGTDLHRLLTSRPLEKQFIQYFLYQILVCNLNLETRELQISSVSLAWPQICAFGWCRPSRPCTCIVHKFQIQSWGINRNRATSSSTRIAISRSDCHREA